MKYATVEGMRIDGICACVPVYAVDNMTFGAELFGSDIENAIKATGVHTRRICPPGGDITALDLSVTAAKTLLENHSISPSDIGGVLFVTQTPDHDMPNNASYAAHLLRLPTSCVATDTTLACSGYVYGLWLGALMAQSIQAPLLLLAGENHSYFTSPYDRSTALLFGDAGTATLLVPGGKGRWHFGFLTDGSRHDVLTVPEGRSRHLFNEHSLEYRTWPDGGVRRPIDIYMDGMTVFNFVVRNVPGCLSSLMERNGVTADELDLLLLHQANLYMMKQVAKKLKFPLEKMPVSLDRYGNSSSATIPVTICSELHKAVSSGPHRVLASGFGAGLSISAVLMDLGPCVCPEVIEYS
ncbi:MAG: ketoacyl-ACP synthase III [Synergistaceae bacterium]|jgi:3-oxoacyl-[acyl-carrier-protein] synthase-3|nr:ketoacyl-ACP synthase III [Synergistaceae bacterium]